MSRQAPRSTRAGARVGGAGRASPGAVQPFITRSQPGDPHGRVLLVSERPRRHGEMLRALMRRGARVQIARSGRPLPPLVGLDLILVDLAHGSGLDRARVTALNRRSGRALVVALHHGALAHERAPGADLAVEGFVRADDWHPLLDALGSAPLPVVPS